MNSDTEFARLWRTDVSGVELFSARLFHHTFSKHMHEEYTIGMNEGGQGQFLYRGETHRAYPTSFNLINPGEVHTGQAESKAGWTFRNIYISVPLVEQIQAQLEWQGKGLPHFTQPVIRDQSLRFCFHTLFQALAEPASHLEQQSHLLETFSQLFVRHGTPLYSWRSPKPETKATAIIRDYLESHYAENISIETLTQLTGLSPYYLIRSFRQQVGLPPHSYQRHWQLVQAKRSLQTSKPLSQIAVEHGFYDQSHLNRAFKRAFGITPGQYQKGNSIQYG
ncbi:AraC family transcriptional regulator [Cyanobacteria bacterium FACHB-471]|nr:AraC family transcriptional regulator [Cyanobacteria bacterium FACHB-471]